MSGRPSAGELCSIVLGILARREMYGYEVAAHLGLIDEGRGLPEGAVYPALRRLEREGLAASRWVEIGPDVPRRRYYVLTPKGEAAVARRRGAAARAARHDPRAARP